MLKRKNQVEARVSIALLSLIVAIIGIIVSVAMKAWDYYHMYDIEAKIAHKVETTFKSNGDWLDYYQGSVYKGECYLAVFQDTGKLGTCYKLTWKRNAESNYNQRNMFVYRNNNQATTPFLMDENNFSTRYDFKTYKLNNNDVESILTWHYGDIY